jgi:hypothetical protein
MDGYLYLVTAIYAHTFYVHESGAMITFSCLRTHFKGLLRDVSIDVPLHMWFQHDGVPPHSARETHQQLSESNGERLIGPLTLRFPWSES